MFPPDRLTREKPIDRHVRRVWLEFPVSLSTKFFPILEAKIRLRNKSLQRKINASQIAIEDKKETFVYGYALERVII